MVEASPAEPEEGPQKPRRRWLRRLIVAAILLPLVLVIVACIVVLVLPWIVTKERVRQEAVSALTDMFGSCVKIGRVEYHPLTGVQLFEVEMCPPPGFTEIPFSAQRIAVRYDLSDVTDAKIVVREVAIDRPHAILETKNGARNLDAFLARFKKDEPEKPKAPSQPLRGQVSPFDVQLEKLTIGPATLETKGEGPITKIQGVSIFLKAGIDPKRLGAQLTVSVDPKEAEHGNNIYADIPPRPGSSDWLEARISLAMTASASVGADVHDGIAIEFSNVGGRVRAASELKRGMLLVPKSSLEFGFQLEVSPPQDWLALRNVSLKFDRASLAHVDVKIDGLTKLLENYLGPVATSALAAQVGLERGTGQGTVRAAVDHLAVPLTELAPYAAAFVPGLEIEGRIALAPLVVEGTPDELIAGLPRKLAMTLALEDVAANDPAHGVAIGKLDGRIDVAHGDAIFQLDGAIDAAGIAHTAAKLKQARLEMHATADRLAWPIPGHLKTAVVLTASGIAAAPATIDRAKISLGLEGDEVFALERSDRAPVDVLAGVELGAVRVETGTKAIDARAVKLGIAAKLDRLLAPALQPIGAKIDLRAGEVALADGTHLEGTAIDAGVNVTDPRLGRELDAGGTLDLTVARATTKQATLERVRIKTKLDAASIGKRYLPDAPRTGPPGMLPATAAIELDVELPDVTVHDPKLGDIDTSLRLDTKAKVDLVRGIASADSLKLAVADLVKLRLSGESRRFMARDRSVNAKLDIDPVDIARLTAALPKALFANVKGMPTKGKVGLSLTAKGAMPESFANLDYASPPIEADVNLAFDDIDLELEQRGFGLTDLAGAIRLGVHKGKTAVDSTIKVAQIRSLVDKTVQSIDGLILTSTAALKGEMWSFAADADQRPEAFGHRRTSQNTGSKVAIDIAYPKHGDLDIRRFELRFPPAGVDVAFSGGLQRRRFGVLRPDMLVRATLDLDRLRGFVRQVGDAHGIIGADLSVRSKIDTVLEVHGQVEADHFSYAIPDVVKVENATGRIPLDQSFVIATPVMREARAAATGNLGDDLEARLDELKADLSAAKALLDSDDILVEAPRSADYQALRPYLADTGARLLIEKLTYGTNVLKNVALEALWQSGVFRVDRFAAEVWDGDVLADIAIQVTADQDVRMRIRATVTEMNLDIPYALAKKILAVKDPEAKRDYEVSGTVDFKFAFRERSLNGTIDLTKLRKPTVERMFGALDPKGKNDGIKNAQFALDISEDLGLRPVGGKVWITQNLMGLSLDWQRLPIYLKFRSPGEYFSSITAPLGFFKDAAFVALRPFFILTAGSYIVNSVNGAFDKFPVSNLLEPIFEKMKLEDQLAILSGRVVAESKTEAAAGAKSASP